MMRLHLFIFAFFFCSTLFAQNSLVIKNGKDIPYSKIEFLKDSIKVESLDTEEVFSFHFKSVIGYCSPTNEENYYVKRNVDLSSELSYQFFERMEVGPLYLYRRKDIAPEMFLYMEKDGRIEKVYSVHASGQKKAEMLEVFKSFVADDEESLRYINDKKFNYNKDDILVVVQYYNRRNFYSLDQEEDKSLGKIFLYRTKFQKIKNELEIEVYGKRHKLFRNDFIEFDMPIKNASRITVSSDYSSNYKLVAGEMTDQYYEVSFDQKTRKFIFEEKKGSERQYEFYKIKKKVGK
jgi:hypothetical protein